MAASDTAHAATERLTESPGLAVTSVTFRGNVRFCRSPCGVPPGQGPHDNGAAYPAASGLRGVPVRRHQSQSRRAAARPGRITADAVPRMRQAVRANHRRVFKAVQTITLKAS